MNQHKNELNLDEINLFTGKPGTFLKVIDQLTKRIAYLIGSEHLEGLSQSNLKHVWDVQKISKKIAAMKESSTMMRVVAGTVLSQRYIRDYDKWSKVKASFTPEQQKVIETLKKH